MPAVSLAEISQFSVAERIQLVEDIWDSIASRPEVISLSDAQREELDRRLEAYQQDPQAGASWQEVQQRVRGHK